MAKMFTKSRKMEIQKYKFTSQTICHLVGHEILNKTLYFVKRYYSQILKYLRKCMKKFIISSNELKCSFINYVMNISISDNSYIMIDVI